MESFSFKELQRELQGFVIKKLQIIKAADGIELAYYCFVPAAPKAIIIFYHGAGFYSSELYQFFAKQLADNHKIGCYLFDVRGHGNSQGPRGDAPSIAQVWIDVTSALDFVSKQYPGIPLYLGGHSSGAGLVLNYSNHHDHSLVNGYLFIAPYFGRNSGANREHLDPSASFVKSVSVWKFIVNALTGGYFCGHSPAVFFNYPEELLKTYPKIVTSYSVTMMAATSPEAPQELFSKLSKPFIILAAGDDEQFIPEKIVVYKNYAPVGVANASTAEIIPGAKHLDVMLQAADCCAPFIKNNLQGVHYE